DFVRAEWSGRRLVRAEAGTRIKELNAWLDANGMGLTNMGGYDHQTVAGVTATSTHGSGIEFGPLNDALRSLDIVVGDGSVQRIEPADGPTDRAAFEAHHGGGRTLVQDDHAFDAICVAMGCMGVICTAMIEVRDRFCLREVRELHPWAKVKADLQDGGVLERHEHYEVAFSPYDDRYAYPCLVTTRDSVSDSRNRPWSIRTRNPLVELAAQFPFTPHVINVLLDIRPSLAPKLLLAALRALVKKRYDEVSFKVFNIGNANVLPAYSTEIGVPMDGRHIEAVETIFRVARERREIGRVYQSSPIALRFVKSSPAYLSMMNGRDTMMIELIGLNGNDGGMELLKAYEEALHPLGEVGVLAEKTVARMDRLGVGDLGRRDDLRHVEVAVGRRRRADADRFVGHRDVLEVAIHGGVHRDGMDAQRVAGAQNAQGDFAAVGDYDFVEH
ncbi:MAG: FAD-binding protein, partial [Proteobacteria bacterium]|nr:FAD-binding protein [Pseudomonadota bacterium]